MPGPSEHLTAPILEQLAEGDLPEAKALEARAHLDRCSRCTAELEAFLGLFALLGELPRFAPSAGFADLVMARVTMVQEHPILAWLRRLVPTSRPGWFLVATAMVAPAVPILGLILWVLSQPLLSPAAVWQWTLLRSQSAAQTGFAWLLDHALSSNLAVLAEGTYASLQSIPTVAVGGILTLLAVAIPLSAWGLVRLTRTPQ